MQLDMFVKTRHAHKLLERGFFHLRYLRKSHMVTNQSENLLGVIVGKTEAPADLFRHLHSSVNEPVETNAIRRHAKRGRLADVMQKRTPGQGWTTKVGQFFQQKQGVHENIALRMKLRRLLHALHRRNFRQNLLQQTSFVEQEKGRASVAFSEHLG